MLIALKGIENPILFDGAEALSAVLKNVLHGWTMVETTTGTNENFSPRIRLTLGARGFERRSPWIEDGQVAVLLDPVDAVCDLLLDIERAYVEDAPRRGDGELSLLHAAAVEMGGAQNKGLVIFPSTHASGKSLLTVALAQAGYRVFADDQLPIVLGPQTFGVAPGFLPRLRRPLPDHLDAALTAFVRAHAGPESTKFRYVNLAKRDLAPLGERAPVKGVVLLDRVEGAVPKIALASEAEVLKACVLQNFGRKKNALQVLDSLHVMVKGAKCVKLTYGEAPEAVVLLKETFS